MNALRWTGLAAVLAVGAVGALVGGAQPEKKVGPDPQQWDRMVDRAINYLKTSQSDDGSWSGKRSPGITGVVVTGLLRSGKVTPQDPVVEKGLKYIESLVNPKAGHIAGRDPVVQLQNYVTSVNVMALCAANRDSYKQVIGDAVKFLKQLQWDEEEGKKRDDDFYGGAGYDSKSRPDLSNTQYFLDALREAGVPPDDPALKKALVFVSRCQNLKTEHNDRPWAGKINDGSFIYTAAGGGETKVETADGRLFGYGSMTYAGIKSLIYCGVSRDDPRIKKAFEWIQKNYTVDANPGMPPHAAQRGLYYYYHTMAKCLDTLGVDRIEVIGPDGRKELRDWRADLTAALAKRQRPDGSWVNELDRWMEGDPNLVTGYALMALSYCKPRK
ncbi:MAG TPA: prenyltransferase/squalene oxidase repeat-containing protein [Gemmataceae bacterium]|nr:prenyltransferase/squalene oxidase repeat-containing protein [Gemmataceae bacterium]